MSGPFGKRASPFPLSGPKTPNTPKWLKFPFPQSPKEIPPWRGKFEPNLVEVL